MIIGSSHHQNFFACLFPLPVSCIRRGSIASFKKLLRDRDSVLVYVCICWWWLLLRNCLYSSMDLDIFFSNLFINFFPRNRTICVEKEKVSQCANITTSFHNLTNLQLFNKPIRMMTWQNQV